MPDHAPPGATGRLPERDVGPALRQADLDLGAVVDDVVARRDRRRGAATAAGGGLGGAVSAPGRRRWSAFAGWIHWQSVVERGRDVDGAAAETRRRHP